MWFADPVREVSSRQGHVLLRVVCEQPREQSEYQVVHPNG